MAFRLQSYHLNISVVRLTKDWSIYMITLVTGLVKLY
jgi:hypothetical protein